MENMGFEFLFSLENLTHFFLLGNFVKEVGPNYIKFLLGVLV